MASREVFSPIPRRRKYSRRRYHVTSRLPVLPKSARSCHAFWFFPSTTTTGPMLDLTFCYLLAHFAKLILASTKADFRDHLPISKRLTRSIRFTSFCTTPISKGQLKLLRVFTFFAGLLINSSFKASRRKKK